MIKNKTRGVSIANTFISKLVGNIPDWLTASVAEDIPLELRRNLLSVLNK